MLGAAVTGWGASMKLEAKCFKAERLGLKTNREDWKMSCKAKTLVFAATAMLLTSPALAQHGAVKEHLAVGGGVPEASATISGTQEKTLIDKQSTGHYSVCSEGSHALTVAYDKSAMDVAAGDCAGVEASKISVKGTDANAYNKAFIFNHTHWHAGHPDK
jgi:hypothetical protein